MAVAVAVFKGVGAAWQFLSVIMEIKDKVMFKQTLDNLQSILTPILPVLKDIERLNNELGCPGVELDSLISKMEEGTKLVSECSKVHRLNCVSRCRYQARLKAFEESFRNQFTTVMIAWIANELKESHRRQLFIDHRNLLVPEPQEENDRVFAYMLTARNLYIVWGSNPTYWRWISVPESRFQEVAELVRVCWLEIRGWIKTSMLPLNTRYEAYFVFKLKDGAFGFNNQAIVAWVKVAGEGDGVLENNNTTEADGTF